MPARDRVTGTAQILGQVPLHLGRRLFWPLRPLPSVLCPQPSTNLVVGFVAPVLRSPPASTSRETARARTTSKTF
jgi:hypothetical protein